MEPVKLTNNGRITIPAEIRRKYKLTPGRKVKFEIEKDGIKLIPLVTYEEIKTDTGFLGTKGKLLKALMYEKKVIVHQKNMLKRN